jgi:hypothetical protein
MPRPKRGRSHCHQEASQSSNCSAFYGDSNNHIAFQMAFVIAFPAAAVPVCPPGSQLVKERNALTGDFSYWCINCTGLDFSIGGLPEQGEAQQGLCKPCPAGQVPNITRNACYNSECCHRCASAGCVNRQAVYPLCIHDSAHFVSGSNAVSPGDVLFYILRQRYALCKPCLAGPVSNTELNACYNSECCTINCAARSCTCANGSLAWCCMYRIDFWACAWQYAHVRDAWH